jgi:hypothetical protein
MYLWSRRGQVKFGFWLHIITASDFLESQESSLKEEEKKESRCECISISDAVRYILDFSMKVHRRIAGFECTARSIDALNVGSGVLYDSYGICTKSIPLTLRAGSLQCACCQQSAATKEIHEVQLWWRVLKDLTCILSQPSQQYVGHWKLRCQYCTDAAAARGAICYLAW